MNWAPLAPVPTWVLGLALKPELSVVRGEGRGRAEQPTQSRFELPERIREGARNRTLYRYGCSLRAHGWKHAEILAELRRANEERCVDQQERRAAPLGDAEVHKIAASAARHEPGTASWATTEVLEVLDGIEAALWEVTWPGTGGKSERSVMVALIKTARRHGTLIPAGVRVSIATRQLAEAAQMPHRSLMRAVSRLRRRQPRMIGKDDAVRQATEAGAFVLLHPPATRARCHHSTTPLCPLRGRVPLELLSR